MKGDLSCSSLQCHASSAETLAKTPQIIGGDDGRHLNTRYSLEESRLEGPLGSHGCVFESNQ